MPGKAKKANSARKYMTGLSPKLNAPLNRPCPRCLYFSATGSERMQSPGPSQLWRMCDYPGRTDPTPNSKPQASNLTKTPNSKLPNPTLLSAHEPRTNGIVCGFWNFWFQVSLECGLGVWSFVPRTARLKTVEKQFCETPMEGKFLDLIREDIPFPATGRAVHPMPYFTGLVECSCNQATSTLSGEEKLSFTKPFGTSGGMVRVSRHR